MSKWFAFILLSLLFTIEAALADTKITQLPLGSAAASSTLSVFPYVDLTDSTTKKLKLSDLVNVPALAAPQFCTAKPLTGFVSTPGTVSATDTILTAIDKLAATATPGAPITIGTYDSQAATANGLVLSSNILYAQSADATHPGMVNTTTQTIAGNKTGTGTWTVGQLIDSGATISTVPYFDASKQLTSSAVTPTELGYVSGVTSAIQTQLNGKQASGNYITALTGDLTASGPGSAASTLATVNSNVGSFTYGSFTVNGKGLITAASSGTAPVTSLTVATANGLAGSFSASTTPVLTLTTSVTGILKGNGTAISAAASGTDYAPATSGSLPLFGSGSGGFTNGSVTGNTTKVATSTGSLTTDNCAKWDASGNIVDAGAACGAGAGTVTTTGSPASGNLTKFSGSSSITSGDLSGDITTSGTLAATLATVNSNVGSFGSSTAIPSFTVNGKGLVTAASTNAVIAPAGTLTGTTLASGVVTSSLTSVGTIATGVWNGTRLTSSYVPTDVAYIDVANSWSANQNFALNALTFAVPNAGTTGTTNGKLAKLNSSGNAIITSAGDTGAVGVVVSGGGTTSNANIMFGGATACVSDNTTVVGHYAQISASVAGDCTDSGTALGSALPTTGGQVVGVWASAGGAGAQTLLPLSPAFGVTSGGGGGGGASSVLTKTSAYAVLTSDATTYDLLLEANCSSACTMTLFAASNSGYRVRVINIGTAVATVATAGSDTFGSTADTTWTLIPGGSPQSSQSWISNGGSRWDGI